eukprot:1194096-Prorocentrum_minimum.AAC.2
MIVFQCSADVVINKCFGSVANEAWQTKRFKRSDEQGVEVLAGAQRHLSFTPHPEYPING